LVICHAPTCDVTLDRTTHKNSTKSSAQLLSS